METLEPVIYVIEVQECGVWDTYGETDSLEEAIVLASAIEFPDDRIRISAHDGRIL